MAVFDFVPILPVSCIFRSNDIDIFLVGQGGRSSRRNGFNKNLSYAH